MARNGTKTGGRQKGTQNKTTGQLKSMISDFILENWDQVQGDFKSNKLHPRDRLAFIEKLLKFAVPAMASTSTTLELKRELEGLSDNDLNRVVGMVLQQTGETDKE